MISKLKLLALLDTRAQSIYYLVLNQSVLQMAMPLPRIMFDELNPRMNLLKVTKGKVNTLLIDNVNRR